MLPGFHFFVGSSLALGLTQKEALALVIGILSHHFLDRLPHLDLNLFKKNEISSIKNWSKTIWVLVISEFFLFLFLTFSLMRNLDFDSWKIAFLGGLGGILPDLLTLLSYVQGRPKFKILDIYLDFHKKFHYRFEGKYFLPLLVQLLLFLLSLIIYLGSV